MRSKLALLFDHFDMGGWKKLTESGGPELSFHISQSRESSSIHLGRRNAPLTPSFEGGGGGGGVWGAKGGDFPESNSS